MHALLCPHGRDLDDLARELATDLDVGLSEPAAEQLLRRLGPNRLPAPERPAYLAIAARQLADPLVALLVAATAVSFLSGEYLAASVIAGIVLLNGVLGFVQEAGAERAVLALRRALRPVASVIRGGQERERLVEEIVPGDLVVLREGDRARLLALDDADRHQPHDATRETRPPDDVNHARDVLVGERRCLGQRLVRRAAHADPPRFEPPASLAASTSTKVLDEPVVTDRAATAPATA